MCWNSLPQNPLYAGFVRAGFATKNHTYKFDDEQELENDTSHEAKGMAEKRSKKKQKKKDKKMEQEMLNDLGSRKGKKKRKDQDLSLDDAEDCYDDAPLEHRKKKIRNNEIIVDLDIKIKTKKKKSGDTVGCPSGNTEKQMKMLCTDEKVAPNEKKAKKNRVEMTADREIEYDHSLDSKKREKRRKEKNRL